MGKTFKDEHWKSRGVKFSEKTKSEDRRRKFNRQNEPVQAQAQTKPTIRPSR